MNKLSSILSILSFIGVIILFSLYFSSLPQDDTNTDKTIKIDSLSADKLGFPVAYVDIDSIMKNYKFIKKMQNELDSQYKSSEAKLKSKVKLYENETKKFQESLAMYQRLAANGALTKAEQNIQEQGLAKDQQKLLKKQQDIANLQRKLEQQFVQNQTKLQTEMSVSIQKFLKEYSSELNYTYVLVKGPGSSVWFGVDSLNISNKLVDALNQEFDAKQLLERTK